MTATRDRLFLRHMQDAVDRIVELTGRIHQSDFASDWVLQNALMRELEVLGEAAGRVSSHFADAHREIPWKEITGLRHKLIHGYFDVDLSIVWRTATINVPGIAPLVRAAVNSIQD